MSGHPIIPRDDTGKVYIEDDTLHWDVDNNSLLAFKVSSIRVIGEYTTMHARFRNEWFVVFILEGEETFQVSAYARGMNEVLSELSEIFGHQIVPHLALATDFKSNVIWPPVLAGQGLYELRIVESKTWFDRIRARLGFGNPVELIFTDGVKKLL